MGALLRAVWLLPLLLCGCTGEDNEHLGRVGRKVVDRAETLVGDPDGRLHRGWQALRGEMGEVGLEGKVSQRLAWDKKLVNASIQVRADGGAVELKGAVRDEAQRKHALELAESTAGVNKVTDSLEVVPPDSP
jgi:BON domain